MNIHIMPVKQFLQLNAAANTSAAIISTSTDIDLTLISCPYVLAEYMDFDYPSSRSFSAQQASQFAQFVKNLPPHITDLIICCNASQSRSPGIAAAICRWFGQDDYRIWDNPQYTPNMLCFRLMAEALDLHVTDMEIEQLFHINRNAFKKAIQKARTGDIF